MSSALANIFVSCVFVVDEHTEDVKSRVRRLGDSLRRRYANYEIVVVDNGLSPSDLKQLKLLLPKVACIRILRLSKYNDTDTAIFAGVEASIGDYICILYSNDPIKLVPTFIAKTKDHDIVFGVAKNLRRHSRVENLGAKIFYWYSKRYLNINIPNGSTYFICMNRAAANALTRSGRFMRHIRHMSKRVGFLSQNLYYELPEKYQTYNHVKTSTLLARAIDLVSNYSSHPLRLVSYFGIVGGILNILYAMYVVFIKFSNNEVASGWTTLSLQSSLMFFLLFMIMAVLAEYIGKILNEAQQEPPYHIMQELSSTVSIADETRRNVTR